MQSTFLQCARRIAGIDGPGVELGKSNAPRPEHGALADGDARADKTFRRDPCMRPDRDGRGDELKMLVSDVVRARTDMRALRNGGISPDRDLRHRVENHPRPDG